MTAMRVVLGPMVLISALLIGSAAAHAFTVAGAFNPASPTWVRWTPADPDSVNLDCALPLDGAELEWPSPYALFCVQATDRQPITLETTLPATEYDPVLYLYCDSFDPVDPREGAIAYDDDDGPGAMARFGPEDGIVLDPDRIYVIMLAWFDSMDFGRYELRSSDNLHPCVVPVAATAWGAVKARWR